ncbi:hypothetical protein DICPUDRAFT_89443 [Dictyostelium purpureum]|uniref:SET domain-containing protein n=1 Tax=Dictyostelium purpureum TaxID=5786 RepID=F0ZVU1_DICPU|nr:uncharacterized protein DICPUDRAFT_89443 [Dictyostelium purpureum]EGC31931.1 hypothetical protein DICPUDRAFT_89443 [Dictyostelium purpureum]|eukprot:XP_003291533.1 hypothetical protein DICPUDRAFT_89443 [Dictyostelium purpureum]
MMDFWQDKIKEDFNEQIKSVNENETFEKLYVEKMKFDKDASNDFSNKYVEACKLVLEDQLTTLTEIILEKDLGSIKYQLTAELRRNANLFKDLVKPQGPTKKKSEQLVPSLDRMCLLFSIASNDFEIFKYIYDNGGSHLINFIDPVTGCTCFHMAMLVGNKDIIEFLITKVTPKINVMALDSFRATGFDYARMKGMIPFTTPPNPKTIKVYNYKNSQIVEDWPLDTVESELNIIYTPRVLSTTDYLVDLLFSSLSINPDIKFRNKYLNRINKSGGEENVILGWISEQVGWGLFANRDFQRGDYIVRYGGMITMNQEMKTTDYNMMISNEDFGLDASKYRSLGGMINHSSKFKNAESECIFEGGCEQALITAVRNIPKGTQIFIDYSKSYWGEDNENNSANGTNTEMVELGGTKEYPSIILNI